MIITERSEHARIASLSCLQKVISVVEKKHGKNYENLFIWSDGTGAQFGSRFIFKLLATSIFSERSLTWLYNERHHGKGPMDVIGGTVKNVIFRKV